MDIASIRSDFPILSREINGHPLVYVDNASTTQTPTAVIDAISAYYRTTNANVARGVHRLSQEASQAVDASRHAVADFLNAQRDEEIVFVRGTTEAINLVAETFGRATVSSGDNIVVTEMEHHANFVPWQRLCAQTGATFRVVPITDRGELDMDAFHAMVDDRTTLIALTHASNTLGTVNPIKACIAHAHAHGARVLIDGAQTVAHMPVDVRDLDADFYAFSGHKLFGPTGIGCLYAKHALLDGMDPYQVGGGMILQVTNESATYRNPPHRFEAGTLHIAGAVGLHAAITYLSSVGWEAIRTHERSLLDTLHAGLEAMEGVRIIGTSTDKIPVVSIVVDGVHPHDIGTLLDETGVAVRTGHHCTQPIMNRFEIPATTRISLAFYNTQEEISKLIHALQRAKRVFS